MKRHSCLLKRRERRLRNSIALRLVKNGVRNGKLFNFEYSNPIHTIHDHDQSSSQPMYADDGHHRDSDHFDVSSDETNGAELL